MAETLMRLRVEFERCRRRKFTGIGLRARGCRGGCCGGEEKSRKGAVGARAGTMEGRGRGGGDDDASFVVVWASDLPSFGTQAVDWECPGLSYVQFSVDIWVIVW